MEKSTVLLFDIDNTLLDFSAGAMQAMEEIFRAAGLPYAPEMFAVFQVENDKLWARVERGELTIAGLRDVRWQTILRGSGWRLTARRWRMRSATVCMRARSRSRARRRCWRGCMGNTACALQATGRMRSR